MSRNIPLVHLFKQYSHEPYIAVVRFWVAYSGTPERFADQIPAKAKGGYAAPDSIADISLFAYTHVAREGEFDLSGYPAIRGWLERVASQPGHVAIDA